MDVDSQQTKHHRVQELWFDDGNVILQAGSAQYKVFRGILARHSTVFQDMFALPQPSDAELVDGCPLVQLPDAEVEVTPFLRALFEPNYFPTFPSKTCFDLVKLYGCLRLSSKYSVQPLRTNALKHLNSFFTSLAEWDEHMASAPNVDGVLRHDSYLCFLQLAHELEATRVLPIIYYIVSGFFDLLGMSVFRGVHWMGFEGRIPEAWQDAFLAGAEEQLRANWGILDVLADPSILDSCESPLLCSRALLRQLHACNTQRGKRDCRDPLFMWNAVNWATLHVCPECLSSLKAKANKKRQQFWRRLPEIYHLPSWEELEAMKKAALAET
ncbi:hypothetical protein HMN09_01126900 [Mycena chlorophos]|uniref:BTB domain-containing protein n=1 Tax=Mycena chlorophos TaxID=658473 RepID=A0A8H6SBC4_MYCCL|nr:hypothetical protein HMN09_01126900 [Mycena chlorophos]